MESEIRLQEELFEEIQDIGNKTEELEHQLQTLKSSINELKHQSNYTCDSRKLIKINSSTGKPSADLDMIRSTYDLKTEKFTEFCKISEDLSKKRKKLNELLSFVHPEIKFYELPGSTPTEIARSLRELQQLDSQLISIDKTLQTLRSKPSRIPPFPLLKLSFTLLGVFAVFSLNKLISTNFF